MIILQRPKRDGLSACPYLPNRRKQFEYFFAKDLNAAEIAFLLAKGWRRFGAYYFRPACPQCRACTPLRVLTQPFKPSKSQRKIMRRNPDIQVKFGPITFSERAYEIYRIHSTNRFDQASDMENYLFNFHNPTCPALQSEFYVDDYLVGVGYLDRGVDCLSSVYFVYDTAYSHLNLGTFSIIKEIEHARSLGLAYYYLGYYVRDCQSMAYKDRFKPREHYDWFTDTWRQVED